WLERGMVPGTAFAAAAPDSLASAAATPDEGPAETGPSPAGIETSLSVPPTQVQAERVPAMAMQGAGATGVPAIALQSGDARDEAPARATAAPSAPPKPPAPAGPTLLQRLLSGNLVAKLGI